MLYEMIIGRPPFSGENAVAIAYKHVQEAPVAPRRIDPAIPETLEAIILKCLAKNPANRYPSAQDMRSDLRRYLEGARIMAEPVLAPTVDPDATAVIALIDDTAPTDATASERTAVGPTRRVVDDHDGYDGYDEDRNEETPRSYAVAAVLVAVLLVLVALLFLVSKARSSGGDDAARGAADVTVPRVVGMQQADAEAALDRANLVPTVETVTDGTAPAGTVVDQNPAADEPVASGAEVTITVSSGPDDIAVPDVRGMTQDEATRIVTDLGLVPSPTQVENSEVEEGLVIGTNPQVGAPTTRGATVEIQVSARPAAAVVPDVTGLPEAEARAALEGAGFKVTTSEEPTRRRRGDGRVLSQNPAGGTPSPIGSEVDIVIGRSRDDGRFRDGD